MKSVIVGISGKQGSGKTTLARGLDKLAHSHSYKFAGALYDMHEAIRDVMKKYGRSMPQKDGKLLQILGTEWGRSTLGENIWVDLLYGRLTSAIREEGPGLFVVDDMRFPNEQDMFHRLRAEGYKVLTVRLECGEAARKGRAEGWRDTTNHPSETALDDRLEGFDLVLDTDDFGADAVLGVVASAIEAL